MKPGSTLLVANRGEIARRIFRTARRLGLRCVAVHSDADTGAPFVREADEAVRIGPAPAPESYLRVEAILEAAHDTGTELVHPGYGFLAEDPALARACEDAGLVFVGPSSRVLETMGDKAEAKRLAMAAGVPVLPGYSAEQTDEAFAGAAAEIGFPLLVKPAAGGGGKGMTLVGSADSLVDALSSARRIARSAFGDERLLIERFLPRPRHVEVQVLADTHGQVLHLGERDCSLQRRHQKILEESPSPVVDPKLRSRLCDAAVALARRVGYRNAGTCEFLVDEAGEFGFIEMNARLQVEHPVTEEVTGLDLVELQLRIALGERIPLRQQNLAFSGHAVEVRVYAEDPDEGYLPQAGRIEHLAWPPDARVDSGVDEGSEVSTHYDPMLAKIIVHGPTRAEALDELHGALEHTEILGVRTNLALLRALAQDPVVTAGKVTTDWLEEAWSSWRSAATGPPPPAVLAIAAAAEAELHLAAGARDPDPWGYFDAWRLSGLGGMHLVFRSEDEEWVASVSGSGPFEIGLPSTAPIRAGRAPGCHGWWAGEERSIGAAARSGDGWLVWWEGVPFEIRTGLASRHTEQTGLAHLGSPLPGQVVAVRVAVGDLVERGQELVVVEAMKMEHSVKAPADGTVTTVLCRPGMQVDRGQTLVDLEPS